MPKGTDKSVLKKDLLKIGLLSLLSVVLFQTHLFIFLASVPLLYCYFKFGHSTFWMMSALCTLIMSFSGSSLYTLLYGVIIILIAAVFAKSVRPKQSITSLIGKSIITLSLVSVTLGTVISKGHPYTALHQSISQGLKRLPVLIKENEATLAEVWRSNPTQYAHLKTQAAELAQQAPTLTSTFLHNKFLGYGIGGLILLFCFWTVILKAFNISVTNSNLSQWKTPDLLVWWVIGSAIMTQLTVPFLTPLSKNLVTIFFVLYFLQGLSIAFFYFKQKRYSVMQRNLCFTLLTLFPIFPAGIGFFDLWVNFRKKIIKRQKEGATT